MTARIHDFLKSNYVMVRPSDIVIMCTLLVEVTGLLEEHIYIQGTSGGEIHQQDVVDAR